MRTYSLGRVRRGVNGLVKFMLRRGLAGGSNYLLTVVGRKSGKPYSTPITLVEDGDRRYLVAPYGEVAWVKNARASGRVTLSRRGYSEEFAIESVDAHVAAPVLKAYVNIAKTTRPFFELKPDAPVVDFEAIAANHPVFLLRAL